MIRRDRVLRFRSTLVVASAAWACTAGCILPGADNIEDDGSVGTTGTSTSPSSSSSTTSSATSSSSGDGGGGASGTGGQAASTGTGGGGSTASGTGTGGGGGGGGGGGSSATTTGTAGGAGGSGGSGGEGGEGGEGGGGPLALTSGRLASGLGHVCALSAPEGDLLCWGRNEFDQMGAPIPPFEMVWAATPVVGLDPAGEVTALALGDRHTCVALDIGGVTTARCWGYGNDGQTGGNAAKTPPTTIQAAAGGDLVGVVDVTAGYRFSCALLTNETVACWGRGSDGSLGEVGGVERPTADLVPLAGLASHVAASPTAGTACAVLADTSIQCWGNGRGVETVPGTGPVDHVAVGTVATLPTLGTELVFFISAGAVWWTLRDAADWAVPTQLGEFGVTTPPALQVAVGQEEVCVVAEDGSLHCATYAAGVPDPLSLTEISGDDTVAEVALGAAGGSLTGSRYAYRCVRRPSGETQCQGSNVVGSIGNGAPLFEPSPLLVTGVTGAQSMTLGRRSSAAFTGVEATVMAWGASPMFDVDSPDLPMLSPLAAGTRFLSFTRTTLDDEGYRYHDSFAFQFLVDGAVEPPTRLTTLVDTFVRGYGGNVRDIGLNDLGVAVTYARTDNANQNGQMGTGDMFAVPEGTSHHIDMGALFVDEIIAAPLANHTCVRGRNVNVDELRCWGASTSGQVGNDQIAPVPEPTTVIDQATVDACVGPQRTCAVAGPPAARFVYCWGAAAGGGGPVDTLVPEQLAGTIGAQGVACGDDFTCSWHEGGSVQCWGNNEFGQLGDGTFVPHGTPALVPGLTGVTEVFANADHACAIHGAAGDVSCWGRNDSRQLGAGAPLAYASPVSVVVAP